MAGKSINRVGFVLAQAQHNCVNLNLYAVAIKH